jgi:hypothetical protein
MQCFHKAISYLCWFGALMHALNPVLSVKVLTKLPTSTPPMRSPTPRLRTTWRWARYYCSQILVFDTELVSCFSISTSSWTVDMMTRTTLLSRSSVTRGMFPAWK